MATATKVLDAGVVASACLPMENVKHTTWLTGNAIITRNQNNGLFFILSLYCRLVDFSVCQHGQK
jgi:hypothetical protein